MKVDKWALADWQLCRPIAAGRLSDRIGTREWFERRYVMGNGMAAFERKPADVGVRSLSGCLPLIG